MRSSGTVAVACVLAAWALLALACGVQAGVERVEAGAAPASAPAASGGGLAVHVQTILGEDLPDPKDPWHKAGSVLVCPTDIHRLGDWLYVPSYDSGRICRFRRDLTTARIAYVGSTPMPFRASRIGARLFVRTLPNGQTMMYAVYYAPRKHLCWYAVDPRTGELTEKGKLPLREAGFAILSPLGKHLYLISKRITWFCFGADGTPAVAGSLVGTGGGNSVMSPDGRHLYVGERHSASGVNGRIVVYDRNRRTGRLARAGLLDLTGNTVSKPDSEPFLGISPDGRHVYVSLWRWDDGFLYVLRRNAANGVLRVGSAGRPHPRMKGSRGLAFRPDGKVGYYVAGREGAGACTGWFRREPATGALTFAGKHRAGNGRHHCLTLDSARGHLFSVTWSHQNKGNSISAFKTTRADGR